MIWWTKVERWTKIERHMEPLQQPLLVVDGKSEVKVVKGIGIW
jgi:hypothetical protein